MELAAATILLVALAVVVFAVLLTISPLMCWLNLRRIRHHLEHLNALTTELVDRPPPVPQIMRALPPAEPSSIPLEPKAVPAKRAFVFKGADGKRITVHAASEAEARKLAKSAR